jgi:cell division septation protein DedD
MFLTGDAFGFPKINAPFEKTEQVRLAMAASEPTSAIQRPEPPIVELVPENQGPQPVFPFVRSPSESQDAGTVSGRAMAANATSGFAKALRLIVLPIAAVLLLIAFLPLRHHWQKAGTSQKGREMAAAPNLPGPSSKIYATATSHPGPAAEHPASTANPGPSLDQPAFVLQVGAMASEENAIALADSLGQMNFPAFVFKGPADRYHHVFVGPFTSADTTLTVKKDLEKRGFKAFRTEWKPISE